MKMAKPKRSVRCNCGAAVANVMNSLAFLRNTLSSANEHAAVNRAFILKRELPQLQTHCQMKRADIDHYQRVLDAIVDTVQRNPNVPISTISVHDMMADIQRKLAGCATQPLEG